MKGYKVILPPKDANDGYIMGQGIRIFTPEGHEVTRVGDFDIQVGVGDFAMLTLSVPIGEIVHREPEPKEPDDPRYREYGDLS